ncbi:hypothetical protein AALP_AA6G145500 [Arabis alpina]|uniref:DUF4283 domain-containing protein n=1 Tax=Arabis alpina TaxID=50452 RepID=A0A087GP80_ARAAL|nr:hypothetical protein AALP_AA6G145500 [Arabis alpina]
MIKSVPVDGVRVSEPLSLQSSADRVEISSPVGLDLHPTSVKAVTIAVPGDLHSKLVLASDKDATAPNTITVKAILVAEPVLDEIEKSSAPASDSWSNLFKSSSKKLEKKGEGFTLPSGEACVLIPNSVIEKNRKSWDRQFYLDPPSQGQIARVLVSSPWMPPVCDHCKEVGHNLKSCKAAPVLCTMCNSRTHAAENCHKPKLPGKSNQQSRRVRAKQRPQTPHVVDTVVTSELIPVSQLKSGGTSITSRTKVHSGRPSRLTAAQKEKQKLTDPGLNSEANALSSGVEDDSSDIASDESQQGSMESSDHKGYTLVVTKKKKKKKSSRGKGPKST